MVYNWLKPVLAQASTVQKGSNIMANLQALPVEFGAAFPDGVCMVGEVDRQNDYERSTRENPVQARDKETGLPIWVIEVIDFDPKARTKTYKVKVVSEYQPVPPEALPGAPLRPVVLENLTVTPYIADGPRPRIAYSLRCTGLAAPGAGRRSADASKAA
jgi:hypothetical protein